MQQEAAHKLVFEPLKRATVNPHHPGLGLGFYIVREIAKGHGGVAEADPMSTRRSSRSEFHVEATSAVAGFAYAAFVLLQSVLTFQRHHFLGGACMVVSLILIFREIRVVSTQVDNVGVSQLTCRGRVQLHWDEVTTVARGRRSVKLAGADGSVIFPIQRFCESKAATGYLDSHLPARFRKI